MKNIVLLGFMGTGKTTVAKKLAARLDMEYISLDGIIEKREGRPITDIFKTQGEAYFRELEKRVTEEVSRRESVVIDAGGGVVLDEANIKNLKKKGILICLSARPDIILKRTGKYTYRPLLNVPEPESEIRRLLETRAPHYAKADHHIDTSAKSVDEVCEKIVKLIKKDE